MTVSKPSILRVGYVPEHFSSPILQLIRSDDHLNSLIQLVPNPSGTGQMINGLKDRSIEVVIGLTESLIAGIILRKADYRLIGSYVDSSLNWAVITGSDSKFKSISDLRGQRIGISRPGSGSQLMASVMALQQGWSNQQDQSQAIEFVVEDSFKNLRDSVNSGKTAAFMWEWFTTKPFSDSGEVRFIGNVPTPWSSWSIAASSETIASNKQSLIDFLERLDQSISRFGRLNEIRSDEHIDFVKETFHLEEEDVKEWMKGVRYTDSCRSISTSTLQETVKVLGLAGIIENHEKVKVPEDLVDLEIAKTVD
ncbi:hypothetical protein PPACK8108_LOCUS8156 [Phakopsora pachyrhizi]|uniref:Ca3427-like PBP 2 domain-containing protein n=2 Tax=Phakopsora pachyrhizi TaxID=170000 RepID=A0AAV0AW80_PHAPC|nr:hypothetical protein PPACK8108_LOCUS8156 [Phakopsora pachyrhizi]